MKIKMKLRDILRYPALIEKLGINPYAINEGADPETLYEVEVEDVVLIN